jgi:hypothetical protein
VQQTLITDDLEVLAHDVESTTWPALIAFGADPTG